MTFDLDGRQFSPVKNSAEGRVSSDAVFTFAQDEQNFHAHYTGEGFSDGHLIGAFIDRENARLIYHCRAEDGSLEAGEANAFFEFAETGEINIKMNWRWLNGSGASGTSEYTEISPTRTAQ